MSTNASGRIRTSLILNKPNNKEPDAIGHPVFCMDGNQDLSVLPTVLLIVQEAGAPFP